MLRKLPLYMVLRNLVLPFLLTSTISHVHSVMGAFGLNASILDAANLAWKLGMSIRNQAVFSNLLPTYDRERRLHAAHIIETSGKYLRFVCNSDLPAARLYDIGADLGVHGMEGFERITGPPKEDDISANGHKQVNGHSRPNDTRNNLPTNGQATEDNINGDHEDSTSTERVSFESYADAKNFIYNFFKQHGQFLLGVDAPYGVSCLNTEAKKLECQKFPPIQVRNGRRAPNPRVCFDTGRTGYLYDAFKGASHFHLVVFGWDLLGAVRNQLSCFSEALSPANSGSFYWKYGGPDLFNIVLVAKGSPWQVREKLEKDNNLVALKERASVLFDDRAPDEDAHNTWGVHHRTGAVVVVRPDLWVGFSAAPGEVDKLGDYFDGFLVPQPKKLL
jgi:phenol 2-monooxygenase